MYQILPISQLYIIFRANTEHLCANKPDKTFSDNFLHQCKEDVQIITEICKNESLSIPPITLKNLKDIIFKKLKLRKACDIYKLTTEHLRYAGDNLLSLLVNFINRVLKDIHFMSATEFKMSLASVISEGYRRYLALGLTSLVRTYVR